MLEDSKTSELSGGFICDGSYAGREHGARSIFWRTLRETIYLTETCLHRNDIWHEVKITFKGSSILAVEMHKVDQFYMLIVTTTSIYRIPLKVPSVAGRSLLNDKDSVLMMLTSQIITSPKNSYNFTNDIGSSLPTLVSAVHSAVNECSLIAIATSTSLHMCSMGFGGDKLEAKFETLEAHAYFMSKLAGNFGKTSPVDVVTMCFTSSVPKNTPLLFTVHRDGTLRVWLHSASATMLLATEKLYKYIDGARPEFHSCVSRGSRTLIGLFISFNSISNFVVLKPKVTAGSEPGAISLLSLQNVCTIVAPKLDLVDFKLCEHSLWSLWCNSEFVMQVLTCELAAQKDWKAVATLSTSYDDLPVVDDTTDLREYYRTLIFKSGTFPARVIKKSLMMLKQNAIGVKGSSTIGSMLRLEREVIDCIKQQLWKEQEAMQQNGSYDPADLIDISNQLWGKLYRCCVQYNEESARPIGLFLSEEMIESALHVAVGVIRKHFVSFIRTLDRLETAYYGTEPSPAPEELGTFLLVNFLKEIEQTLTQDEKQKLDGYVYHRQVIAKYPEIPDIDLESAFERCKIEDDGSSEEKGEENDFDDISLPRVSLNSSMASHVIAQFGAKKLDIVVAVSNLLRWITPDNQHSQLLQQAMLEKASGGVSVYTGPHFYGELAVATAKQTVAFRYTLLRNLLLLQHLIRTSVAENRSDKLNRFLAILHPHIVTLVRCYNVMNWVANMRLAMNWTHKRNEIVITFPTSQQHAPVTLLQAYARCRENYKCPEQWISEQAAHDPLNEAGNSYQLSLTQKACALISYISPTTDDFRFGEWLSENELSIHIDGYVELVGEWCAKNKYSRALVQAKSFLLDGEPFKSYDLFLKARLGLYEERYLLKFASGRTGDNQRPVPLYEIPAMYFLQAIRLFDLHNAYDIVPKLVNLALQETLNPEQQSMFRNIAFSSYMAMGRYKLAYHSLWENADPARRKDCLRQVVSLLLSQDEHKLLAELPTRGQVAQFIEIVTMNARAADIEDGFRYDFLYSFLVGQNFHREAANVALEGAMRYASEKPTQHSVEGQFPMLLKSAAALANVPAKRAWLPGSTINDVLEVSARTERNLEVIDAKKLQKQMIILQSVRCIATSEESTKQLASLEPKELVVLLMRKRMYNRALELAHCCVHSMVPEIYQHITSACISITSTGDRDTAASRNNAADNPWLYENLKPDVRIGRDTASTAWNYLRYMIEQEPDDLVEAAHHAVLDGALSGAFHVPTWVRAWCFERTPVKLVRAYYTHGFVEDACECMIQLFEKRTFNPPSPIAFPLTLVEHLCYHLENSPNRSDALRARFYRAMEEM